MRLRQVDIVVSPNAPRRVRLEAEVSYLHGAPEVYWLEVDREFEGVLSRSGNPWLACLLPLAMTIGEPLELSLPVDPVLYEGAQDVMSIWKVWYPHLRVVPIEADTLDETAQQHENKAAVFFSGGVDSFFTVLRHQGDRPHTAIQLDDLILVHGLADIPLANGQAFERACGSLVKAADELGKRLVPVSTNLRETRWNEADWY